jgi:putative ABC transport system permease protein
VFANLRRKRLRTLFTVLSIAVAFVLFCFLSAIDLAFSLGVDISGADRLIMIHKVSIIQPLPMSYLARLEQMPDVVEVTHATWFGGIYQDPKNFFPQMAVDPEVYLDLYPELLLTDEEREAWIADRTGAIVGRTTAERFGFEIGDRVPIQGTVWRKKDGSAFWEFTIDGIYRGREPSVDETNFFFHYDYFDEARQFGEGLVGWYILRIDDPAHAVEIADRIDAAFANSRYETKTTTEKAFIQAFANQIGDIGKILGAVLTAVFFTILLVAGNTMAQAVRERTGEIAVLKTLGYSNVTVLGLVLAESLLIAGIGGAAGLGIGYAWVAQGDPTGGFLSVFYMPGKDVLTGVLLVASLGLAAGALPAFRAMRLGIVDGLRKV